MRDGHGVEVPALRPRGAGQSGWEEHVLLARLLVL